MKEHEGKNAFTPLKLCKKLAFLGSFLHEINF